ncbi:MAG: DIP1984 family protein [Oscillospiraceae bacterium]|nr:DIP1984 family protein [Oscillospiraceae bacterium]
MKLAEALQERADLNRRIQQLQQRLNSNAIVQEGESPAEDPRDLLNELDRSTQELEELITRINLANCRTMVRGESLTALLSRRDALKLKLSAYRDLVYSASQLGHRATHTEIKLLSTVSVKDLQKQVDAMAKELRLLDNTIQASNWTTELD